MKVLVTGATGYLGASVARVLIARGHQVRGTARSADAAARLRRAGVEPVDASLHRPHTMRAALTGMDSVLHAAFARAGVDDMSTAGAIETAAVAAMLADAGTRPFLYVSGIGVVGPTGDEPVSETDPVRPAPGMRWRRELEQQTLAAQHGIVVRPGLIYGRAGGFVMTGLIRAARQAGEARYLAPGDNSWPTVHLDDVSALAVAAIDRAPAGTVLHAVAGHSTPRAVATAIARLIGRQAVPQLRVDDVPFGGGLHTSQCIDATFTRQLLGWSPAGPAVEEDVSHGSYRSLAS